MSIKIEYVGIRCYLNDWCIMYNVSIDKHLFPLTMPLSDLSAHQYNDMMALDSSCFLESMIKQVFSNKPYCDFIQYTENPVKRLYRQNQESPSFIKRVARTYLLDLLDGQSNYFTFAQRRGLDYASITTSGAYKNCQSLSSGNDKDKLHIESFVGYFRKRELRTMSKTYKELEPYCI